MTSRSPATFVKYPSYAGFQGRMTITELLNKNGYATGHFGKWSIGKKRENGTYGIDKRVRKTRGSRAEEGRDAGVFTAALKFIEAKKDVPFYINIWSHSVHFPVDPHPSLAAVFNHINVQRDDFPKHMQVRFDEVESIGGDLNKGMANYLGEVYSLDLLVGKLMQKLDGLGTQVGPVT